MSISQIRFAIENFLGNTRNDFLLLKGAWGAGKTHFWQELVSSLSYDGKIGYGSYSYVTLFGIDSLESLKNAIMAAKINSDVVGKTSDSSFSNLAAEIKKEFSGLERIPFLRNYTGGLVGDLTFRTVRDTVIVIDDFERKSKSLDVREILGLASLLKEQRDCKIVFISNDDKIPTDDEGEFLLHKEKLIDIELTFAPTPVEAFEYIFPSENPNHELLKDYCLTLGITNLRTLQRIGRYIEDIERFFDNVEPSVKEGVIKSLTLFVWSYYDRSEDVPSLEDVMNFSSASLYAKRRNEKEKVSEAEEKRAELFIRYGYSSFTETDEPIVELIKNGFLDEQAFTNLISERDIRARAIKSNDTFSNAWKLFTQSLSDNEDEFVNELMLRFEGNVANLEFTSVEDSIEVLRDLGRNVEADRMADVYVSTHKGKFVPRFEQTIWYQRITDAYLRSKIDEVIRSYNHGFVIDDVIKDVAYQEYPEYEKLQFLASQTTDDFLRVFESVVSNGDLYTYAKGCLRLEELTDPEGVRATVAARAREALTLISNRNNINRVRIQHWFNLP